MHFHSLIHSLSIVLYNVQNSSFFVWDINHWHFSTRWNTEHRRNTVAVYWMKELTGSRWDVCL